MRRLERLADRIDAFGELVGRAVAWLAIVMVLLGSYNAVIRYVGKLLGKSLASNTTLELQWYLFAVLFLGGAAWTLKEDAHVRVDVIYGRLSRRGKAWIDLLGTLAFLIPFCVFGVWVSVSPVIESWSTWEGSPDPGGLPRYPIKTLVPLAFMLLGAQGVSMAIRNLLILLGVPPSQAPAVAARDESGSAP
jgi:TRAP-type mannitol/chloroaromatic compound transport system permease small subunit